MALPNLNDDLAVISKLDDLPNDVGGLTAAELKAKFDEAAGIIQTFINDTFIPYLESNAGAAGIGIDTISGITSANTVQEALAALQQNIENAVVGTLPASIPGNLLAIGTVPDDRMANPKANVTQLSDGSVTKLGTSTVGGTATPIYLNGGTPAPISADVGNSSTPVFLDNGEIKPLSNTVGSATQPVYLRLGAVTACSGNAGSSSVPVYMSAGELKQVSVQSVAPTSTDAKLITSGAVYSETQSIRQIVSNLADIVDNLDFKHTFSGTIDADSWIATDHLYAETTITDGAVSVDEETFRAVHNDYGNYAFDYDGSSWSTFANGAVSLPTIGISLTGTPSEGRTITVTFASSSSASAVTDIEGGSVSVTASTFAPYVNSIAGEYVITYDGSFWNMNYYQVVSLTTYGITIDEGTPASSDTINVILEAIVPYTQAVTVLGVLDTDNPHITPEFSNDNDTAILEKNAWADICKAEAVADAIIFTCFDIYPETDINFFAEVVR